MCLIYIFSEEPAIRVTLTEATQSTTQDSNVPAWAIDGDLKTSSETEEVKLTLVWFKVLFDGIYCVNMVKLLQISHSSSPHKIWRMKDTRITVLNSEQSTAQDCNVLADQMKDGVIDYEVWCTDKVAVCGDQLKLEVEHDKHTYDAAIQLAEIQVYAETGPQKIVLVSPGLLI